MKLCKYCNIEKSLDLFPIRASSKDGRVNKCKKCTNLYIKEKNYKYETKLSKDEIRSYNKEYNIKNKKILLDNKKIYYKKNKESILEYRKKNRNIEYQNKYSKLYRTENIEYFQKYRTEYEDIVMSLDDLLNAVMLEKVLSINPANPLQSFVQLGQLNNAKAGLNNVMKFIDGK
jgi:hypothetical protein